MTQEGEASLLIKRGTRRLGRVRSRLSLRLWSLWFAAGIAVLLGLSGTVWLLIDGTRGANIASVLGLWLGVLGILVPVWTARRRMSSTESPEMGSAPKQQSGLGIGRTGGIVVAITVAYGLLLTMVLTGPLRLSTSGAYDEGPAPTTPPAAPATTPMVTAEPTAPLPSQVAIPVIAAPSGLQPIPVRIDPSRPATNPSASPGFGGRPRPMGPPPHHHPPPPEQADFGPTGTGVSCSPLTAPAVRIKAIAATDGLPGIATHNFIDLEVLRANRPGYTYWIIAHLIGTNGNGSPYIAKQQVRSSVGAESHALQLDADINSVREIYIVEADPDGTEKLRQNNQLPMDGSQDNQSVRVNPPPGQTVSVTCRVTKTRT